MRRRARCSPCVLLLGKHREREREREGEREVKRGSKAGGAKLGEQSVICGEIIDIPYQDRGLVLIHL